MLSELLLILLSKTSGMSYYCVGFGYYFDCVWTSFVAHGVLFEQWFTYGHRWLYVCDQILGYIDLIFCVYISLASLVVANIAMVMLWHETSHGEYFCGWFYSLQQ